MNLLQKLLQPQNPLLARLRGYDVPRQVIQKPQFALDKPDELEMESDILRLKDEQKLSKSELMSLAAEQYGSDTKEYVSAINMAEKLYGNDENKSQPSTQRTSTIYSDEDIDELRGNLFGEIGRTGEKAEFEARIAASTALNRLALDKDKKVTLKDILTQKGQYQAFSHPDREGPSNLYNKIKNKEELNELETERLKVVNKIIEEVKSGKFVDTTDGAYSYYHCPAAGEKFCKGKPDNTIWIKEVKNPRISDGRFFND